jgi:hypothetical protein
MQSPSDRYHSIKALFILDSSFADIWPLINKGDPQFGNITATAPVNTNHLAIGYGE